MCKKTNPNKVRECEWLKNYGHIVILIIISIVAYILVNFINIEVLLEGFKFEKWFLQKPDQNLGIWTTMLIAAISFLVNRIVEIKKRQDSYDKERDCYKSEISDIIRHLSANIKILKGLEAELTSKGRKITKIGYIHFTNLKIPEDSILLSNIATEHALFKDLKAFVILRVCLRNINNRAEYLEDLSKDVQNIDELIVAIKWEIRRHIGLWARISYFHENGNKMSGNFVELIRYITGNKYYNNIDEYLQDNAYYKQDNNIANCKLRELATEELTLSKNDSNDKNNMEYIDTRFKEFIIDRTKKRDLLIFEEPNRNKKVQSKKTRNKIQN